MTKKTPRVPDEHPHKQQLPTALQEALVPRLFAKLRQMGLAPSSLSLVASLDEQPDWSFVIQCHALVETAINDTLIHRMKVPEIRKELSKLSLSFKAGLLRKLATAIGPLDSNLGDSLNYIARLSDLRNRYAHNFHNVGRSIDDMLGEMDAARKVLRMGHAEDSIHSTKTLIMVQIYFVLSRLHVHDTAIQEWDSAEAEAKFKTRQRIQAEADYAALIALLMKPDAGES